MYVSKFHIEVIQIEISMAADHIFVIEERELKMGVWGNIQTQSWDTGEMHLIAPPLWKSKKSLAPPKKFWKRDPLSRITKQWFVIMGGAIR